MPAIELPGDLHQSLEEALAILAERAPSQLRAALQFRRALEAGSPILRQRFLRLIEDALSSPEGDAIQSEERRTLARTAADLEAHLAGRRGPKPRRDNSYRLMVFLSPEERDRLECLQEALGNLSAAEIVRRALTALEQVSEG